MLPYFKRSEDNERGASEFHGDSGPQWCSDIAPKHELMEAIIAAIHTVDDPESFDEFLRALGRDHRKYHVDDRHYATMGVALLDALRSTAGDGWNLEYDQAWRDAYAAISAKIGAVTAMGAAADASSSILIALGSPFVHVRFNADHADKDFSAVIELLREG